MCDSPAEYVDILTVQNAPVKLMGFLWWFILNDKSYLYTLTRP